jgi:hypothetical protein
VALSSIWKPRRLLAPFNNVHHRKPGMSINKP